MAPFRVRSKVCIAPIHVRSKVCKFILDMDGGNADFALHMEGSYADFAPHMEWRHSFRDKIIAKTAWFANFEMELFKVTNILRVYMIYMTNFKNKNILRGSIFKRRFKSCQPSIGYIQLKLKLLKCDWLRHKGNFRR